MFTRLCNIVLNSCLTFPGEKLVNFMVEPKKGTKWPSNLPRFENRQDAVMVCKELCNNQFLLRSEKQGKGELGVSLDICMATSLDTIVHSRVFRV